MFLNRSEPEDHWLFFQWMWPITSTKPKEAHQNCQRITKKNWKWDKTVWKALGNGSFLQLGSINILSRSEPEDY